MGAVASQPRGGQAEQRAAGGPAPASSKARSRSNVAVGEEVVAFLGRIGLQVYAAPLLRNGWDDMETLLAITDEDMKDLGLSSQHSARLRAELKNFAAGAQGKSSEEEENHPVVAFLRGVGLGQYARSLLKNGWDEMDILLLIEDADMKDLGMKPGHVLKLKKKLKEYQLQQPSQEQPQRAQSSNVSHRPSPGPFAASSTAPVRASTGPSPLPAQQRPLDDAPVKKIIQQSWDQVQQFGLPAVGELLCKNTLALAPDVVNLFQAPGVVSPEGSILQPAALRHLFAKVVKFVGCAVSGRYDYPRLVETLEGLGADRTTCDVRERHWKALGQALDGTLRQVLGGGYTSEVQRAWMTAYNFMSSIMIDGLFASGQGKSSCSSFSDPPAKDGAAIFQFSVSGA